MRNTRNSLRRTATEVKQYRNVSRILRAAICLISVILVGSYIISILYSRYGSFTVTVARFDQLKYSLSLSETPDFAETVSRLNCVGSKEVNNISRATLPKDLDQINGAHNGENYVAYTFYCKNSGEYVVDYQAELYIANASKGIDAAAWVRLYINGEYVDYARTATDGSGPEPGSTAFLTETTIARKTISGLKPGEMTKFTVVIWLEGEDPDCVDSILGGNFKIDMSLSILNLGEN